MTPKAQDTEGNPNEAWRVWLAVSWQAGQSLCVRGVDSFALVEGSCATARERQTGVEGPAGL
jgi:hypothetical protein